MVLSHSCSELLGAGRQHIRHQSSGQLDSCSRGGRDQSRPRLEPAAFGCGIESRKAHALAERRGSSGARVCEMRQQTTDDRRLSAERLNDRRFRGPNTSASPPVQRSRQKQCNLALTTIVERGIGPERDTRTRGPGKGRDHNIVSASQYKFSRYRYHAADHQLSAKLCCNSLNS